MCSAVLAHCMLNEKLQKMGMLGCLLCIVGSTEIVLHAPQEKSLTSVDEIWQLALQPGMQLLAQVLLEKIPCIQPTLLPKEERHLLD